MNKNLFLIIFIIIALFCGFILGDYFQYKENLTTDIVFFGMGKADSIFIRNNSKTMLIDTGTREKRKKLVNNLKELGVKKIDYLILTHPDKDHIGGAYYIIDNFKVERIIQSKFEKGNKAELRLKESLKNTTLENIIITTSEDYKFDLGNLKITIYPPREDSYTKSNDYSLITHVEDGDLNYIFAGDAEEILLSEILQKKLPPIDIYKVPHHGKWNINSVKIIEKISPKYAIITNNIGDKRVIESLKEIGAKSFYVFDNDVHFRSDGKNLKY